MNNSDLLKLKAQLDALQFAVCALIAKCPYREAAGDAFLQNKRTLQGNHKKKYVELSLSLDEQKKQQQYLERQIEGWIEQFSQKT